MRVAITALNGVVSPRLDQAPRLVIVHANEAEQDRVDQLDIARWPAHGRASRLALLGIDTVICGGVSSFDQTGFDASCVKLISGVSGPVSAVINAVREGTVVVGQSYWGDGIGAEPE